MEGFMLPTITNKTTTTKTEKQVDNDFQREAYKNHKDSVLNIETKWLKPKPA